MKRVPQNISAFAAMPAEEAWQKSHPSGAQPQDLKVVIPLSTSKYTWIRNIVHRVATKWHVKMFGTMSGMVVFFIAYFWILEHPNGPVSVMKRTAVDELVPFQPQFLPAYLSLWFYVSFAPALLVDRREIRSYAWATLFLSTIGMACFLLWPTAAPQPEVDWSLYPSFAFLRSADGAGNACPSLHVSFAVFTAIWFERLFRQMNAWRLFHVLNWVWCACILYSTIAIRQHVVLDVLAGAMLGAGVAFVQLHRLNRKSPARIAR